MLPSGWATNTDSDGRVYYYNTNEGITQWERPADTIGMSKPVPDFTSLSTGTPSFLTGNVDLEAGITTSSTTPPSADPVAGSLQEARSNAMKYFDVTTEEIGQRLLCAILPYRMLSQNEQQIKQFSEKPDLYGPFWICVTIGFALFVGSHAYCWASDALTKTFYVEFYVATCVVFAFWLALPVAVRLVVVWNQADPSLFQLAHLSCIYGYSLLPIAPLCILCTIPSKFLQLIFVGAALGVSLAFLAINFFEQFGQIPKRLRAIITATVACVQVLLFMLFPLYFFHLPTGSHPALPPTPAVVTPGLL